MPDAPGRRPKWRTYLTLGRVSNLPTVWSNALAGAVLAGGHREAAGWLDGHAKPVDAHTLWLVPAAGSLFYVGGMFLNDWFDRAIDARVHPERPIPSGEIAAGEVCGVGFGLLAAGLLLLVLLAFGGVGGVPLIGAGVGLGAAVILYDSWHKANALSPVLMGVCRMLVYVIAALAVSGEVSRFVAGGAVVLLSYLIGLTYAAKQETLARFQNFWPLLFLFAPFAYAPAVYGVASFFQQPVLVAVYLGFLGWVLYAVSLLWRRAPGNIPRAVVSLIAGISLLDGLLVATQGETLVVGLAVLAFAATLMLQRYVRGT
jgi:UbiA prenyltransferase family